MSFLGPVTRLQGRLVRPHDLELRAGDPGGGYQGRIERVVRVGFEVRVHVVIGDETVLVTLTRTQFQSFGLDVGDTVWVCLTPGAPAVRAGDGAAAVTADHDRDRDHIALNVG
jgi:sulfate transport system ATP-binding protein